MITRSKRQSNYRQTDEPKFKKLMRCAVFLGLKGGDSKSIGKITEAPPKSKPDFHAERQWIDSAGNMDKLKRQLSEKGADVTQIEIDLSDEPCPVCAISVYPRLRTEVTGWKESLSRLKIYVFLGRAGFRQCYEVLPSGSISGPTPCSN
jgi:hypothetical protein